MTIGNYFNSYFNAVQNKASLKTKIKREGFDKSVLTECNTLTPNFVHYKSNYLVSFKGLTPTNFQENPFDPGLSKDIIEKFSPIASKIFNDAITMATLSYNKELEPIHLTWAIVDDAQTRLKKADEEYYGLLKLIQTHQPDLLNNEEGKSELDHIFTLIKVFIEDKIDGLPKVTDNSGKLTISKDLKIILEKASDKAKFISKSEKDYTINDMMLIDSILEQEGRSDSRQIILDLLMDLQNTEIKGDEYKLSDGLLQESVMQDRNISLLDNKSFLKNLSILDNSELINLDFYQRQAQTLLNILQANKNAIITSDNGILPELLAHTVMSQINSGTINSINNYNTEVELFDVSSAMAKGKNGVEIIEQFAERARNHSSKKYILFIKEFDRLTIDFIMKSKSSSKYDPSFAFKNGSFPSNLQLVGFMQENIYEKFTDIKATSQINDIQLSGALRNNFEKMVLRTPSPSKTKEILKTEPRILASRISNFNENIEITNDAIDKIVDQSVRIRKGGLPLKAIDLCNFIIAAKLMSSNKEEGFYRITKEDVNKFMEDYPDFRQSQESTNGKFSLQFDTGITFKDVGGVFQAKEVLMEVLDFIKNPSKYKKIGARMPKGVLLYGPPGNGKTHLAKAIAGEANVPFISTSGSTFVEQFVGVGAQRVRELFNFARDLARSHETKTAIIFIDEFDSLGKKRSGTGTAGSNESEQTLNELLVQMDGLDNNSDINILVLAATNRKDLLDEALTDRPGRFDNIILVPNPENDTKARYEILKICAAKLKLKGKREKILRELADRTSGFSGAKLADLLNKAAIKVAKDNRVNITINDLIEAKLESLAGRIFKNDKPQWYKEILVAHECGHALVRQIFLDIAKHVSHRPNEIDTITLDERGTYAGAVYSRPGENVTDSFESVFAEIASKYGGYAVEKNMFGLNGTWGISSDLENATSLINLGVTRMGMGPNMGLISPNGNANLNTMFLEENKTDIKLFSKQTAKVASLIVDFHRNFIDQYMQEYKFKAGKGGNNLSGEEFKLKLEEWRHSHPELQSKYEEMIETIGIIIENTKNGVDSAIRRTEFLP